MSSNSEINFSNYGVYDVNDNLELFLPNTTIKRALDKAGIEIPFPQRVIWGAKD